MSTQQERREAVVRAHMEAENRHDFETVMGTFAHPRYELVGSNQPFDGDAAVRDYFRESRAAFPDQRNELIALHHSGDSVIAEFWLMGTHRGPLSTPGGALPPTGRSFRVRMCAFFVFGADGLVAERIYFDRMSILSQLTPKGGVAI